MNNMNQKEVTTNKENMSIVINDIPTYERGMVVWCRDPFISNDGERHTHPYLIISNDTHNKLSSYVIACILTTNLSRIDLPTSIVLQGYGKTCSVLTNCIYTLPKANLGEPKLHIHFEDMVRVEKSLIQILGLNQPYLVKEELLSQLNIGK